MDRLFFVLIRKSLLLICLMIVSVSAGYAQDRWKDLEKRPSTLSLDKGTINLITGDFRLSLLRSSQTVAALNPVNEKDFDFTPHDRLKLRSSDGMYQLGDIDMRLRIVGDNKWTDYNTSAKRKDITDIAVKNGNILAAADLSHTLSEGIPLIVERYWKTEEGHLVLLFVLKNNGKQAVEVGSLGIPMIFNNILQGKSLEETHAQNVFYDPYIGRDAGYLQVTRLSGKGPALLVVPYGNTPFEAYNPLLDDPTPRGIDFEGFYEWMVHSKAYADNEWKTAEPWNKPTSLIIKSGDSTTYGLKFILADSIKGIEKTLVKNNRPVAVGVPGYVLPKDVDGKLFLNYHKKVKSLVVEPAGSLNVVQLAAPPVNYQAYSVKGLQWGRARLTITYEDGLCQTINYKVINPETDVVKTFGHFLTHQQWFENKKDPFGRDQSVITYDYEKKQQVKQDSRVWISGLSDEGGAGGWLGAMVKELVEPDKDEITKLQYFVNHTLWGNIQYSAADSNQYGVKKSVFYYQPDQMPPGTYSDSINYKTWAAWNHQQANDPGRSYNYPHVTAAHWVLYKLARNHIGLVTGQDWKWYLDKAYQTAMAMVKLAPYYAQYGQMEGTIFYLLLMDLKAEGWSAQAKTLEDAMKLRADHWHTLLYPFGSEMPWDSTGQEEVYTWSKYFGYSDKAEVTINAILGYMPTVPHWGYNGSARRYWDFLYGGKLSRVERQLHHYGSGLNAIPVLSEYRSNPGDLYLLRVGYGGLLGSISNITEDGFGSAAFHSFPSTLKIDGLSGDYGSNFFGYAVNTGTYIVNDKELGWLSFGGNTSIKADIINVDITTAAKSRAFIAPLNLWLTLDAGKFKGITFNQKTKQLFVELYVKDQFTPVAYLHIVNSTNGNTPGSYHLNKNFKVDHERYVIPLDRKPTVIELTQK